MFYNEIKERLMDIYDACHNNVQADLTPAQAQAEFDWIIKKVQAKQREQMVYQMMLDAMRNAKANVVPHPAIAILIKEAESLQGLLSQEDQNELERLLEDLNVKPTTH